MSSDSFAPGANGASRNNFMKGMQEGEDQDAAANEKKKKKKKNKKNKKKGAAQNEASGPKSETMFDQASSIRDRMTTGAYEEGDDVSQGKDFTPLKDKIG